MPVTLGKNCTLSLGGASVTAIVRDVQIAETAQKLEYQRYGERRVRSYTTGYTGRIEVEFVDDPGAWSALKDGSEVAVSSSAGSETCIVTAVQRSEPLDDIVTFRVSLEYA